MELALINRLLKNIESPDHKILKKVKREEISTPIPKDGEGSQGDENVFAEVYQFVEDPSIYIKVVYYTDSYGYGQYVRGVQFVKPVEKVVTIFE